MDESMAESFVTAIWGAGWISVFGGLCTTLLAGISAIMFWSERNWFNDSYRRTAVQGACVMGVLAMISFSGVIGGLLTI